jgi:ABC-type sugar transport system substrate-binding protein
MKKLAVLALLVPLAGCSRSSGPAAPPRLTVGVAFEILQTEYWVASFEAMKSELKKRDIAMLDAIADGDANRQLEQVQNFIAQKVAGIIVVPKDAKVMHTHRRVRQVRHGT